MADNPFKPNGFKKRVITVSVTKAQDDAFETMKAHFKQNTDSAMVKHALAALWERMGQTTDGLSDPR